MLEIVYAIAVFQGLIIITVIGLVIRRLLLHTWLAYLATRFNYYSPFVLNLLEQPDDYTTLKRISRPFDRGIIKTLLLQQATELRGHDRAIMTAAFEYLGYVSREVRHLASSRWWKRRNAVMNLSIMLSNDALPALIEAIKDPEEEVRLAAVRSMGPMNDPRTIETLFNFIDQESAWTTGRILEVLIERGDDIKEVSLSKLARVTKPKVRLLLIQLAGLMKWIDALPLLLPLLDDPNDEIRISSARAIGIIGDGTVAEHLTRVLDDSRWEVKAQAYKSLGILQEKGAVNQVAKGLYDPNWWVRYNSSKALYQMGEYGRNVLEEIRESGDSVAAGIAAQALSEGDMGL